MNTASRIARRHGDLLIKNVRELSELAVTTPGRYVDTMPASLPWSQSLSYIQPSRVTTLDNGFRVVSQAIPHCGISQVGVYIDAGSRYETDSNNGVAHFLEHLMFKGTKTRSMHDIEKEVENIGAHLNAYTSRELTAYYARCTGDKVPQCVSIIGDILLNSTLEPGAISRERDVILREAQEVNGIPEEVCLDHLHSTAFQHTPLGRTILGPAQNIKSLTREDMEGYIRSHYTAGRMVLTAAGDVDHEALVAAAKKTFSSLPADSTTSQQLIASDPSHFTGSQVNVRDPDEPVTALAIAFQGAPWLSPDSITLQVMQAMLGTWNKGSNAAHHPRSMLATAVAQNELVDRISAFNSNYHDTGLFGVYAQTSVPQKMDDLCYAIMTEITRLCYENDSYDVQLAKNAVKTSILNASSSTQGVCEELGRHHLVYGRHIPRAEMFARIDDVTPGTVSDCASRLIQDQDMAVAAVGELSFLPDYNWFRRNSYWLQY